MYRRYRSENNQSTASTPQKTESVPPPKKVNKPSPPPQNKRQNEPRRNNFRNSFHGSRRNINFSPNMWGRQVHEEPKKEKKTEPNLFEKKKSIIEKFIPSAIYNSETKKVFGIMSAEDLMLVALIFVLMENDEKDDTLLIYALVYILVSDYIDLDEWLGGFGF